MLTARSRSPAAMPYKGTCEKLRAYFHLEFWRSGSLSTIFKLDYAPLESGSRSVLFGTVIVRALHVPPST